MSDDDDETCEDVDPFSFTGRGTAPTRQHCATPYTCTQFTDINKLTDPTRRCNEHAALFRRMVSKFFPDATLTETLRAS